jgi:hypothetical protein
VVRLLARNWVQLLLKAVPRQVFKRRALAIAGTAVRQAVYHSVRSRHPIAYLRGLLQGVARARRLIQKRKTVLGWRQVGDADFRAAERLRRAAARHQACSRGQMSRCPQVLVVIVSFHHGETLPLTIESLHRIGDRHLVEVIVIDNGGDLDASIAGDQTVLIRPDHNLGYAAAANLATRRARADLLLDQSGDG